MQPSSSPQLPLQGIHIVSLALNLPGPAALMRLKAMGAQCTKVNSPAGDPMEHYNPKAYAQMHAGIDHLTLDLKTTAGQATLHNTLERADVLLTSFRPSALRKLNLDWSHLHSAYPELSMVCIVGSPGVRAEEPGHDLTYLAENNLVAGTELPSTLYADMAGSLATSEAVLQSVLVQKTQGRSSHHTVALSDAAAYLALPRTWGLTAADGAVGGAHAGYRVYSCNDGRVAVAALEPHFAAALCRLAQITSTDRAIMLSPSTHDTLGKFFANQSCAQLTGLAAAHDIPLHCMLN